jgi:hypothetical protein
VFLCFVTLFLLAYIAQTGVLNTEKKVTKFSLVVFAFGVVINEILLWAQGVGAMFIEGSAIFTWLLWGAGLCLFIGATLIFIARIMSKKISVEETETPKVQDKYKSSVALDLLYEGELSSVEQFKN